MGWPRKAHVTDLAIAGSPAAVADMVCDDDDDDVRVMMALGSGCALSKAIRLACEIIIAHLVSHRIEHNNSLPAPWQRHWPWQ